MTEAEIVIERLAAGGSGVGRVDGMVCFVPFTAPGDRLRIRITGGKRTWKEGEALELLEASAQRVTPRCSVFGLCGGCDWQHIEYEQQCRAKRQLLVDALQRIAGLPVPPLEETVSSSAPYEYRARAQFKLHGSEQGLMAGFFRRGSKFVIELPDGCPVVTPAINQAMLRLKSVLAELPDRDRLPQLSLEEGEAGVYAIVHYIGNDQRRLGQLLLGRTQELGLAGLFLESGRKETLLKLSGDKNISYKVPAVGEEQGQLTLFYGIGGFSQVNRYQNMVMINLARRLLDLKPTDRLLDLFCGNGNLSLPLAHQVSSVVGIEEYAPSIASAIDNAGQLRVNNSTFKCCDAAEELGRMIAEGQHFEVVLLDPPRAGALEVARQMQTLGPSRILYVSCDPATLARDAAVLAEGGYRLETAVPLDMFPQTAHLETVALFTRS